MISIPAKFNLYLRESLFSPGLEKGLLDGSGVAEHKGGVDRVCAQV